MIRREASTLRAAVILLAGALAACGGDTPEQAQAPAAPPEPRPFEQTSYVTVPLVADLENLSADERKIVPLLIDAVRAADDAFWLQVFGPKRALLKAIADPDARHYAEINYGPWDRLADNMAFLPVPPRPAVGRFYPIDIKAKELDVAAAASDDGGAVLRSPYTIVRRGDDGALLALPYHEVFAEQVQVAVAKLREAAAIAERPELRRHLELRAEALASDEYEASEEAWMASTGGGLDLIIGPLDAGEDHYARIKRAYAGAVLSRVPDWNARLGRYRAAIEQLGVAPAKDLAIEVADVLYVGGVWNAGPKRMVLEMPAEERVIKTLGSRRLQLRNVAQLKFDETLVPLSEILVSSDQRRSVTFDAFFTNSLLLEMARARGGSERTKALRRTHGPKTWIVEVAHAGMVGLDHAARLAESGLTGASVEEHYATFLAAFFRSVRFGIASAQGPASLVQFNYLRQHKAILRDAASGTYRVDVSAMGPAVRELAEKLSLAHDADDATETRAMLDGLSRIDAELSEDLGRVTTAGIPLDVAFEQGPETLGL